MKSRKSDLNYPLRQEVPGPDGLITWSLGGHALTITPDIDVDKLRAAKLAAYCETAWHMGYRTLSYALARETPFFSKSQADFDQEMSYRFGSEPSVYAPDAHPFRAIDRLLEMMAGLNEAAAANGLETISPTQFMERINAGQAQGHTLEVLSQEEVRLQGRRAKLESGEVVPEHVSVADSLRWVDERRTALEVGLLSKGALFETNLVQLNAALNKSLLDSLNERKAMSDSDLPADDLSSSAPQP